MSGTTLEKKSPVTLATIASAAGCSVSTVSRALRGNPALPARTVERIRRLARRFAYQPNPLVTEVMRHLRGAQMAASRGTVAYLMFGAGRDEWRRHLTFVGFFEGAQQRARELGFSVEQFWADDPGMKPARLGRILLARGITGVIVGPSPGLPRPPDLDWSSFSSVKIGVPFLDLPLPCAVSNHYRAMIEVIARLKGLGYRRFGLVLQEHQNIKTSGLWLAPLAYHEQHLRPSDRVAPLLLPRWEEAEFAAWYRRHRPEVVIGLRGELITWLARLKREVPRQVGFVHLDRCTEPGDYAGIDQKPREVGAAAVDMVVNQLLSNQRDLPLAPRQLLVEGVWVDGPTVRQVRPAPSSRLKPRP